MSVFVERRTTIIWALFRLPIRAKTLAARREEVKRLRLDAVKLAKKYRGGVRIGTRRPGGLLP